VYSQTTGSRNGLPVGGSPRNPPVSVPERQGTLPQPCLERFPFEVLHDDERGAVLVADVVQGADVRMIELRGRAGFAVEALAELRISGERRREDLDRDGAIETSTEVPNRRRSGDRRNGLGKCRHVRMTHGRRQS